MVFDREAQGAVPLDQRFRKRMRVVCRVVEDLNLEQSGGIFDFRDFVDKPLHHVTLVIQWKLNGDGWELLEAGWRVTDGLLPMLEVSTDNIIAVQAIHGENRQNGKVRDEHRPIEPAQLVDAYEGPVGQTVRESAHR